MDVALGLYEDPATQKVVVVRYDPTPPEKGKDTITQAYMLYNGDFRKIDPPFPISIPLKDVVPLRRKYKIKEYTVNVIGEVKSIGYILRSLVPAKRDFEIKLYPLYGSGIYGVSCPYRLPDSTHIKLTNPLVISNKTETKLVERVFRRTLEYFEKLGSKDPRFAENYIDKIEREEVINGWNILISLTDPSGGPNESNGSEGSEELVNHHTDISDYLKDEFFSNIEKNWVFGKNPHFTHEQLWTMLKNLDNRLLPSPVTIIMTAFFFDGIVTLDPKSTACVTGNVIYPPHATKVVYGYL